MSNNPPSQESYEIVPANNKCSGIINNQAIVESPGASSAKTSSSINTLDNQSKESTRFDNVDDMKVTPLSGGKKNLKKFFILFSSKKYISYGLNEIDSIKVFINNRIFKKDYLLEIFEKSNKKSVYIIRGFYKNKFIKIH
jgi:hypothetical protein